MYRFGAVTRIFRTLVVAHSGHSRVMAGKKAVMLPVALANELNEIIELNGDPFYWNVDICEVLGEMVTLEIHFRGTDKKKYFVKLGEQHLAQPTRLRRAQPKRLRRSKF